MWSWPYTIVYEPQPEQLEPFNRDDIRRRDPKQPAWANGNQPPNSPKRRRG